MLGYNIFSSDYTSNQFNLINPEKFHDLLFNKSLCMRLGMEHEEKDDCANNTLAPFLQDTDIKTPCNYSPIFTIETMRSL